MPSTFARVRRFFRVRPRNEDGFVSAQFVVLMGLSILILATFVNILVIENMRTSAITSLRNAARDGTRVIDLKRAVDTGNTAPAINACVTSMKASMSDLFNSSAVPVTCTIVPDPGNPHANTDADRYFMRASISAENNVVFVPLAAPFRNRLKDLSATFSPSKAARDD